jgi:AcrR family transcriptional regulator
MTQRPRGRPRKAESSLSKAEITAAALRLLQANGMAGFTMRDLAQALVVTPMALYHYFPSRDDLLTELIEAVFGAGWDAPQRDGATELKARLAAYCGQVIAYPALTVATFTTPALYGGSAPQRLTERLLGLLEEMGLPQEAAARWLDILVDYTHGFALAIASSGQGQSDDIASNYRERLSMLVTAAGGEARKKGHPKAPLS